MSLVNDPVQFKINHQIEGLGLRPPRESEDLAPEDAGLEGLPLIFVDPPVSLLMQKALEKKQGALGPHGELIVSTGSHTGRAADDKYVVYSARTENTIWWENKVKSMGEEAFELLYQEVSAYLQGQPELFRTHRSVGEARHFAVNVDFLSEMPSAALFTEYLFKTRQTNAQDHFTILHAPFFEVDPFRHGTRSDTVIATSFDRNCIIIAGSQYAGEIKKAMFSVMNFLAPEQGILPMHAGAALDSRGQCFAFFGLSGTGKTTLSHDHDTLLIGDDEHGLSSRGLFNFEGGCYAKTYKLNVDDEPEIYHAATQFSSLLENVKFDEETRELDFFDARMTENGRASYPLEFIKKRVVSGEAALPQDIFFLTADAFGVLPALSRLTLQQAVDYFLLGYTSKLAGTEIGVKEPLATFSPCFGAPFMLRPPMEYAKLLAEQIEKNKIRVWLVNTGWCGGSPNQVPRIPLSQTRKIIRAVQTGEALSATFNQDAIFGLCIPEKIQDVDGTLLDPAKSWGSPAEYQKVAQALKESFENQLRKFRH